MRLTEKQERILAAAMLQANLTAAELAKQTGFREHSVRYCLQELTAIEIIRPLPVINIHALGYTDYCLFFSQLIEAKAVRKKLLKALVDSPQTAWVAELGGEYQFTASLLAKDIFEVDKFLRTLTEQCGGYLFEKSFAVRVSWTSFCCKYLGGSGAKIQEVTRGGPVRAVKIDREDFQILSALAREPGRPLRRTAASLGMSTSTLHYRVKTLEKRGIIAGYIYYVDAAALGRYPARLVVYEKHSSPDLKQKLFLFAKRHPCVTGFVHCIGAWDYELNVEVAHPRELAALSDELRAVCGDGAKTVKVLALLDTVKTCLFPFSPNAYEA